MMMVG